MLDTLHRWTGGLVGLILALLGLSGAILIHRDAWVMLPHSGDAQVTNIDLIALATDRMMADPAGRPDTLQFASGGFGLNRLSLPHGAGAYADQAGTIVTRWSSQWQRPEIWLFDFHHHLFTGDIGETVIGVVALCGLFFVISGAILWWHTRRTYHFRLLPSRLTRPAILRHHRDLGILLAPLLALSLLTGAILVFRPIAAVVLGPGISAELAKAAKPPAPRAARLADHLRWGDMIRTAHSRFPAAELRLISLPRKDNGLIAIRMRQPEEWLPNGRTMLWFAADSGALVMARDSRDQVWRVKAYNLFYPLHAAKVGGLAYRLVMTLSGLALMLLGGLTVWSFWFGGGRSARRPALKLV